MKKEFLSKVFSALFAAIMVISLLPMNVFAATEYIEVITEGITITQLGESAYKVEGLPEVEDGYSWYYYPESYDGEDLDDKIADQCEQYAQCELGEWQNELANSFNEARVMVTYDHPYYGTKDMSEYDFVHIIKMKDGEPYVYAAAVLPLPKDSDMGHSAGTHEEARWIALDQTQGPIPSGYYYLSSDMPKSRLIAEGAAVVICLNGHTWSPAQGTTFTLKVSSGATVRICDCSSNETGKINGMIIPENKSTIELHSGTIGYIWNTSTTSFTYNMYGGKIDAQNSYGINLDGANSECTINIYDGVIVGDTGIRLNQPSINGVINVYGGSIEAVEYGKGYGIYHKGSGAVNMSGGAIRWPGAAIYTVAEEVNLSGDALIRATNDGISFGNDASSAGIYNRRPKLKISGNVDISTEGQAIRVFNTIDIEGQPTICGNVYCGSYPNSDVNTRIPYPMFNITGELEHSNNPIEVLRIDDNLVIARAWETIGLDKEKISDYFTSPKEIEYNENNDEVYFNIGWTLITSPIEFKDGNKATGKVGARSVELETLYTYNPNSYTVAVTGPQGTYTGAFVGNKLVITSQSGSVQAGTYNVKLQQVGKEESKSVTVEVELEEPLKIGSLADLVDVEGKTVAFNLDPNKKYIINIMRSEDFPLGADRFNASYEAGHAEVLGHVGKNVTLKEMLTHDSIAAFYVNPNNYPDMIFTGAGPEGLVSSYESVTITDGGYVVICEVKEEDKFEYIDDDGYMPDYSGDYYVVYAVHSVYFPATVYDVTFDTTNFTDGRVLFVAYDSKGNVTSTSTNGALKLSKGGKVCVYAENKFVLTTDAEVEVITNVGVEGYSYGYEITDITASTTVVVNKVIEEPAHVHSLTKIPAIEATCETAGNNEYYKCTADGCDEIYFKDAEGKTPTTEKAEVIAAKGHADTNKDGVCDSCKEDLHKHVLTKVPAVSATCTTAGNKEHYKCICGELFADAEGKTAITLKATEIAALGHDWSGEWVVTKDSTATEEGKKETLCERECGQKKVVSIPKVGEIDENGNLEKDAEVEAEAPVKEATLNNTKNELINTENIFTKEDKEAIERGEDARVWIEISKTDETTIADADKSKMEEEAAEIMGENVKVTYFDVDLFKQVGAGKKEEIAEPGVAIKITITIPEELLNKDKKVEREYKIIRLHTVGNVSEVDVISGEFNAETGEFSFETNKFSTYAIVYSDAPAGVDVPNTGDATDLMPMFALLFVGVALMVVARKRSLN